MWLPETGKDITPIPCMPERDKSGKTLTKSTKELKHCTWLNKDVPSYKCYDWCYKADRIPFTCEHFRVWWREMEKWLIEAGVIKC
jgi:hypothetical protein